MLSNDRPKVLVLINPVTVSHIKKVKWAESNLGQVAIIPYEDFNDAFEWYNKSEADHFMTLDQDRFVTASSGQLWPHIPKKDLIRLEGVSAMSVEHEPFWIRVDGEFYALC